MTITSSPGPRAAPMPAESPERILGAVRGARPGPLLLCVAGLHGNEPAGVRALAPVLNALALRRGSMTGDVVAVAGNLAALRLGRRFVARDLNRAWTPEIVDALRSDRPGGGGQAEDAEQRELLEALEQATAAARGPVFVLDLHTTSGSGGPFATVGDTIRNRAFALHFPVPLILGLEELVDGTLTEYLSAQGHATLGFEAGQHAEPAAVDRAEAAVWIAVAACGLLPELSLPELGRARKRLVRATASLPRVLEMRYRHPRLPGDGFRMEPGFRNFQVVTAGTVLARDRHGDVRMPETGRLLMPLYQALGEDGFFVVREFRPFWLNVSRVLRKVRLDRVAHWLPGVSRHPTRRDALVVDPRVARWFAVQLFHLLGYRKHREENGRLMVVRRPFDRAPPWR